MAEYYAWVDGAVKEYQYYTIGYIIKDNQNEIISTGARKFIHKNARGALEAEYKALERCLRKLMTLKIRDVVIYSDSKNVVDHLNFKARFKNQYTRSKFEQIRKDLLKLFRKAKLSTEMVQWIPRNENKAHSLAQLAKGHKKVTIIYGG